MTVSRAGVLLQSAGGISLRFSRGVATFAASSVLARAASSSVPTAIASTRLDVASALIPRLQSLKLASGLRQASTTAATGTRKRATTTKTAATKKKTLKARKPAAKKPKLKPWEALGPDGKKLPLPFASKPTKRSSFIIYMQERVASLKDDTKFQKPSKADPSKQSTDVAAIARHVGEEWRSLDAASKQKYTDAAAADQREYERKMRAWQDSLSSEDIKRQNKWIAAQRKAGKKGTALIKDPKKPKRPLSAFFEFMQEYRVDNSVSDVKTLGKEAAQKWKSLSAEEKMPYEQKALGAAEQYKRDMETYKSSQL